MNFIKIFFQKRNTKKRIQIYRFLIDSASDGVVLPIIPSTKKLGHERPTVKMIEVEKEGVLSDLYSQRKTYISLLEPIAIKYELSMEELLVISHIALYPKCKNYRELGDFIGMPVRYVNSKLKKLEQKKLVTVSKSKDNKYLKFSFSTKANALIDEIENIEVAWHKVRQERESNI